jgi:hypothetical protein
MDDVRWLSYGELAEARGISKASAQRLVMRRRWPRRRGNDQTVRVAVPVGEDQPKHDDTGDVRPDVREDITQAINALGEAVAVLRQQLEMANGRAEKAEQAYAAAETRLREVEQTRAEFWTRTRWQRLRAVWRR